MFLSKLALALFIPSRGEWSIQRPCFLASVFRPAGLRRIRRILPRLPRRGFSRWAERDPEADFCRWGSGTGDASHCRPRGGVRKKHGQTPNINLGGLGCKKHGIPQGGIEAWIKTGSRFLFGKQKKFRSKLSEIIKISIFSVSPERLPD